MIRFGWWLNDLRLLIGVARVLGIGFSLTVFIILMFSGR